MYATKTKVEEKVQEEAKCEGEERRMQLIERRCGGDVRSVSGHDEGSASKLVGMGCSELWRVHKDRRNLSNVVLV